MDFFIDQPFVIFVTEEFGTIVYVGVVHEHRHRCVEKSFFAAAECTPSLTSCQLSGQSQMKTSNAWGPTVVS
jgi:hypothetical protein